MAIRFDNPVEQPTDKKPATDLSEKIEIVRNALADKTHADASFGGARKRKAASKARTNIRIDVDVLEWFRSTGPGWQVRMQDALRSYMDANKDRS